jgi:hypothetical protein
VRAVNWRHRRPARCLLITLPACHIFTESENLMSDTLALSLYFLTQQPPESGWSATVDIALSQAERWLRRDPVDAVDGTRETLVRRANRLSRNHYDLLAQAASLRQALRSPDADDEALRERVEDFAAELQGLEEAEARLVLESVTTDIGVGD